ncbi:hypothetical protein Tco_1154276 [Tanacetum coccineum]
MAKRGFSNNTLNDEEDGEDLLLDRYLDSSVRWVVRKTDHGRSHTSRYSIHPGADKMYHESERFVLWPGKKKKDIVESLAGVLHALRLKPNIRNPQDYFNNRKSLSGNGRK